MRRRHERSGPIVSDLKVAVLGVGSMGASHARTYAEMDNVRLVAVADPDDRTARRVASRYGCAAYGNFRELLDEEEPDIVSVAVPTRAHGDVACEAMSRGVHVLIEKPLAPSVEEGRRIIDCAAAYGVKLAVGHIERFNPAVAELKRRLAGDELGRIFQIHARRLSPFPGRVSDVGVILDMATHDIDVMHHLLGADVERVFAETEQKAHATCEDLVSALVRFSNGVIGLLDVNWLTPTKVRTLTVLGEGGMYVADYLTQDVYWHKNTPLGTSFDSLNVYRGAWEGDMVKVRLNKKEPLRAELESFVQAVIDDVEPAVTGLDGLYAIDLSLTLVESGRLHQPLAPSGVSLMKVGSS
jgi:UDP-N-acetylglucosamine 3-dehydrogenase